MSSVSVKEERVVKNIELTLSVEEALTLKWLICYQLCGTVGCIHSLLFDIHSELGKVFNDCENFNSEEHDINKLRKLAYEMLKFRE